MASRKRFISLLSTLKYRLVRKRMGAKLMKYLVNIGIIILLFALAITMAGCGQTSCTPRTYEQTYTETYYENVPYTETECDKRIPSYSIKYIEGHWRGDTQVCNLETGSDYDKYGFYIKFRVCHPPQEGCAQYKHTGVPYVAPQACEVSLGFSGPEATYTEIEILDANGNAKYIEENCRTVTKYRQEERQRPITKTITENC